MEITSERKPAIIKLSPGDELTVASSVVLSSRSYKAEAGKTIAVRVYGDFFVVVEASENGVRKTAFSDGWYFQITEGGKRR